jgi:hypothetical protein
MHPTLYSHGNQSLAVTYYADSELNISEGESMGLRVAFEVCTAADAKIKVLAFFRAKPTLDLVSLRVVECEGVDNPDHRAILESQLRSANTDDRLRQGKPENALAQFVKNASSTLARIHFRP